MTDAILLLEYLFGDGDIGICPEAADVNADGRVDMSDPVNLLTHLFGSTPAPDAIGVWECD